MNMTVPDNAAIMSRIKNILVDVLKIKLSKIKDNTKMVADLKADPVDLQNFFWELEWEFDLVLPDETPSGILTIKDATRFIATKIEQQY